MSAGQPLTPIALSREGADRLVIEWNDGHRSVYNWKHLRQRCPCAGCREETAQPPDPFRILSAHDLKAPKEVRPTEVAPVGRYAYKITWNDGHDTGIYTLENLRDLCQCPQCCHAPASTKGEQP